MSDNKFLAKIASDFDKPRGFAVLSRSEAPAFLAGKPVSLLWGVGTAMQRRLAGDGITLIGQLAEIGGRELASRYGRMGARLAHLARGSPIWPAAKTTARFSPMFRRTRSRPRPLWRGTSAMRVCSRAHCGRSASAFRLG